MGLELYASRSVKSGFNDTSYPLSEEACTLIST